MALVPYRCMRSAESSLALLAALICAAAGAEPRDSLSKPLAERLSFGLESRAEWGLGTVDARSQKLDFAFDPEAELELHPNARLTAIGELRVDAFDRLEPGRAHQREISVISKRVLLGDRGSLELRELYLDTAVGSALLRLGKQQVVWGKSDGLKVLDVVDPQTFREFVLADFEASRIARWKIDAEVPVRDVLVQALWIPDPTFNEIPEPDWLYAFTAPSIIPPLPAPPIVAEIRDIRRPKRLIADSDAGLRLSSAVRGWDVSLHYLYHYHHNPIPFREVSFSGGVPLVTVTPRYERSHLAGGAFSNAFGDLTLRGELAVFTDRYFATTDRLDGDGVFRTANAAYVLGFDWYGFADSLLSFQLFQDAILRKPSGALRDAVETHVTLLARREFWNETLTIETLWIHGVDEGDGLVRPRAEYELRDGLRVWAGLDLFYGPGRGVFGQFGSNDRVVLGLALAI